LANRNLSNPRADEKRKCPLPPPPSATGGKVTACVDFSNRIVKLVVSVKFCNEQGFEAITTPPFDLWELLQLNNVDLLMEVHF